VIRRLAAIAATSALVLAAAGCGGDTATVRLLTHSSFLVSDAVVEEFTATTGFELEIIQGEDAGSVLNQAILTAGNPVADVLFGVDTTFLSRAIDAGLFTPHRSPAADGLLPGFDAGPLVTPIDFGDVCINYDRAAFDGTGPPETLDDLLDPAYRDMLVVENPATSSPGLAFLLATVARYGDEGPDDWRAFWAALRENGVAVAPGWEEAYYGRFSATGGDRPMVVSYASSPPAAVIFSETPLDEAPTAVLADGCFRQVEYAGILRGAENADGAAALIDFMLTPTFQEDMPLNMFVFPAVADAELPPEFVEFTVVPEDPETLDPAVITANRERWIEEWTEIVLG
jgi:thiamine transport system substrate-binding protein